MLENFFTKTDPRSCRKDQDAARLKILTLRVDGIGSRERSLEH